MKNSTFTLAKFIKAKLNTLTQGQHPTMAETDLMFRRKTNRYAPKGTISRNKGYLAVDRCNVTGRFVKVVK